MSPFLEARNLRKTFPDPQSGEMLAIDDVSLSVDEGEILTVVGPSGGGKSTLLRLLAGLVQPQEGEVRFRGRLLDGPRREIGFVFQRSNLMPWRTVLRNITLPLEVSGIRPADALAQAHELLELVDLTGFAAAFPGQLSGGMRQRVALARALIHRPSLLLLDEPFGALDALTRERMNCELLRIWEHYQPAVVMVTHSIHEAVYLADRVLVMSARPGHIRCETPVHLPRPRQLSLMAEPEFVRLTQAVRSEIVD